MKKKTILRTLAAASAVALLLGGAYLLTKDDFRQKLKEKQELIRQQKDIGEKIRTVIKYKEPER